MEAFRRVLQLEAERGYQNRAVVGGLDRFLDRWRGDLTDDQVKSLSSTLSSTLAQRRYGKLSLEQRERWVYEALAALGDQAAVEATSENQPKQAVPKSQKSRAAKSLPEGISLDSAPTVVRGIGPGIAQKLGALGIKSIRGQIGRAHV